MARSRNARDTLRRSGTGMSSGSGGGGGGTGSATDGLESWLAGAAFNDTATPLIAGIGFFEPGTGIVTVDFEAVAKVGNATVVGTLQLWDASNNVLIATHSLSGASAATAALYSTTLTIGTPALGVIAAANTRYEIRISVAAPSLPTDFIEHWESAFVFTAIVAGGGGGGGGGTTYTNADGSIAIVGSDIAVGVLATDAQHGNRGGGALHATATALVSGFMSASDKVRLDTGSRRILIDDNADGYTHVVTGTVTSVLIALPAWAQAAHSIEGQIVTEHGGGTSLFRMRPNSIAEADFQTKFYGTDAPGVGIFSGNYNALISAVSGAVTAQKLNTKFSIQMREFEQWMLMANCGGFGDSTVLEASICFCTGHKVGAWEPINSLLFTVANTIFAGSTFKLWAVFDA